MCVYFIFLFIGLFLNKSYVEHLELPILNMVRNVSKLSVLSGEAPSRCPTVLQPNPAEPVLQFMVHNHEFSSLGVCSWEGHEDSPSGMTQTKLQVSFLCLTLKLNLTAMPETQSGQGCIINQGKAVQKEPWNLQVHCVSAGLWQFD